MSVNEEELQADEVLEARTGSRVPFTMVGDWVLLSNLSPQAKLLYTLLAAHVNVSNGTTKVWPSLETLADLMGLKNYRSVSRYIDELIEAGAIGRVRERQGRMRTRNSYYVNGEPPEGLDTPTRFADYYRSRNEARGHVSAGQPVVTSEIQRSTDDLQPVVTPSVPELDEVIQLDQSTEPPARSHASEQDQAAAAAIRKARKRDRAEKSFLTKSAAGGWYDPRSRPLVDEYCRSCRVPPAGALYTEYCVEVSGLIKAGYPDEVIREALVKAGHKGFPPKALPKFAHEAANAGQHPERKKSRAEEKLESQLRGSYERYGATPHEMLAMVYPNYVSAQQNNQPEPPPRPALGA